MKLNINRFIYTNKSFITSAVLMITLLFAPGMVFATDKDAHEDRTELRIKDLHTKLKITSAQEEQWAKVAQVMLEDAKVMDALTQVRVDHAKNMTAIDDLKSYGEIADAHANGIKKLIPVFAELYANMSDTQKKEADILFREGVQTHKRKHQQNHKKSGIK